MGEGTVASPDRAEAREALVRLSAAHASLNEDVLREGLAAAVEEAGEDAVQEVLLQSYLFLGFPAAIWGFGIWRSMGEGGPTAEAPSAEGTDERAARWRAAGKEVCERVYGSNYAKLRENVRRLHPELDRWMILEGYGKVLSRPGLDLQTRELCIVASLAVTRWEPQLHSHLRGALNVGAEPAEIRSALETGLRLAADGEWETRARALWSRILTRHVR